MRNSRAIFNLIHPIPSGLTVLAAAVIAEIIKPSAWTVSLSMLLVVAFSQIGISLFNDLHDIDLDAVARPERALPRGLVSLAVVEVAAIIAIGIAVLMSAGFSGQAFIMVVVGILAGVIYSAWLKPTRLSWLPFAIAFPLLPAWEFIVLRHHNPNLWTLWVVGVPAAIAVHISDAIPDLETDGNQNARGVAVRLGQPAAGMACRVLLLCGALAEFALSGQVPGFWFAITGAAFGGLLAALSWLTPPATLRHIIPLTAIVLGGFWVAALCHATPVPFR